jgi:hypothetical protein
MSASCLNDGEQFLLLAHRRSWPHQQVGTFLEHVAEKVGNLGADALKVMLTDVTNSVKAEVMRAYGGDRGAFCEPSAPTAS